MCFEWRSADFAYIRKPVYCAKICKLQSYKNDIKIILIAIKNYLKKNIDLTKTTRRTCHIMLLDLRQCEAFKGLSHSWCYNTWPGSH